MTRPLTRKDAGQPGRGAPLPPKAPNLWSAWDPQPRGTGWEQSGLSLLSSPKQTEPLPHPPAAGVVPGRGGRGQPWDRVAQTLTLRTPPPPLPCQTWSLLSLQKERDVTGAGREARLPQLSPQGPGAKASPSSALGPALRGPPPPRHSRHSQGDSYAQVVLAPEQAPWNFIAPFKTQTLYTMFREASGPFHPAEARGRRHCPPLAPHSMWSVHRGQKFPGGAVTRL